ncbi:hypothetical protein OROMI_014674 [Orobanche minor]
MQAEGESRQRLEKAGTGYSLDDAAVWGRCKRYNSPPPYGTS